VRFLGRTVLFVVGLLLAIPAGLVTLGVGIAFEPAAQELIAALGVAGFREFLIDLGDWDRSDVVPGAVFIRLWALSATLLILPPALVALIGEVAGARSFVWYGLGCGALTAALPWLHRGSERLADSRMLGPEGRITALLFLTGAVAGFTYWLVAGRSAGLRSAPVP
jgi:hypothetical protein